MTLKRLLAALVVAAGLGLVAYALFAGASEEELIRARLDALEASLAVHGESTNPAVRGMQLHGDFSSIFEKDVTATIPELGSPRRGREDLVGLATQSTAYFHSLDVDFTNLDVRVDGTQRGARVDCQAVLTATQRGESRPRREARAVGFRLVKHDAHGWRIASVTVGEDQAGDTDPYPETP